MKAIEFAEYGPPEVLALAERDAPTAGPGQVQVRVRAAGVNPADYKWREGALQKYRPLTLPHVPGYDIAGEISAIGDGVTDFAVGDRVVAVVDHGYAEFVKVDATSCARIPRGMDFVQAAALPTPALTGVQMVEEGVAPSPGQTVLVTGATGGVGRFAARAAQQLGAKAVVAVRNAYAEEARALGFDRVIGFSESLPDDLRFDHVADTVGGADVARLCRNLVDGGKIITVSTTPIDPDGLRATPRMFGYHADGARLERIVADVAAGGVVMPVAHVFPLAAAAEAHRLIEQGTVGGRVVLMV